MRRTGGIKPPVLSENDVKSSVIKQLELWEMTGDIIWWERLNCGKVRTQYGSWMQLCRAGTPDLVAVYKNKDGDLNIVFIELKASNINRARSTQNEFIESYGNKHNNFRIIIVNNPVEFKRTFLSDSYNSVKDITDFL